MRRSIVIALLLALLAVTAFAQTELTIGVDVSTTGPAASLGIPNKNGALLGPPTIAGLKVRYIYLDDRSDPTVAVQNVKRLISEDNIDILLGPSVTPTSLAIEETVAEAKVSAITFGSAKTVVSPVDAKRRWIFKSTPNDDIYVQALISHMARINVKRLSIIAFNDSYGESWIAAITKAAREKGITIASVERFERTDTSTTPQALRVMRPNPDAVLVVASGTPAVLPFRSLVELGFKGRLYQSGGAVNPEFLRLGGKAVERSFAAQSPFIVAEQLPDGYPIKKAALELLQAYEAKYGPRSSFAPCAWDALKLIEAAVPRVLKTGAKPGTARFRQELRDALENSKAVIGASAVYTMSETDHAGVDELGMAILKVVNGKWKLEQVAAFK